MSQLLKDIYNPKFYDDLGKILAQCISGFDTEKFNRYIFDEEWEARELKDRMKHTALVLHRFLSEDYKEASLKILEIIETLEKNDLSENTVEYMFFPAYVENFGVPHFEASVKAMERITQFTSCEFAVRPFYLQYADEMIKQTLEWANHPNSKVRRLASEGCRPRLPWAMAIPYLKKDPSPIIPVLEKLKNDTSESVRRSVANNLNDISKDHPELVLKLAKKWKGKSADLDWVVRHGLRTLLKQGNSTALAMHGYGATKDVKIKAFSILTPEVKVGEDLIFTFTIINESNDSIKLRLEYGLYYQKANGSLSRKVFKISEREYGGNSENVIERKQSFKVITTRKLHAGKHALSIILNGIEKEKLDFNLSL